MNNYSKNISDFVTYDYIKIYRYNHSQCLNYQNMQLNDALTKDLKNSNFSKEFIANILNNCTFDKTELLFTDENGADCFIIFNITDNETVNFIYAKNYLVCEENNFYNIKMNIFNKFENEYKINLENLINNIIKKIKLYLYLLIKTTSVMLYYVLVIFDNIVIL